MARSHKNGPEWGDSDTADSDEGMDISQGSQRVKEERETDFDQR